MESTTERDDATPLVLPVCADRIPDDLKAVPQWAVWEADWLEDNNLSGSRRLRVVPCDPLTHKRISLTDTQAGKTFETALAAYREGHFAGIGFLLTEEDPFLALQISDAFSGGGLPRIEAVRALRTLTSYAERSPDHFGITILVRGHLPPGGCRRETIELGACQRFIPITGCSFAESASVVAERQTQIEEYHAELFPSPPKRFATVSNVSGISNEEMLHTAFQASNGARIQQLYRGDISIIPGGRDAADLALCSMLGFYTGNNPDRLDQLFRQSGLFREKWDTVLYSNGKTYGQATVIKALEGCLVFHTYPVHAAQTTSPSLPLTPFPERQGRKRKENNRVIEQSTPAIPFPAAAIYAPSLLPTTPTTGSSTNSSLLMPVSSGDSVNPMVFAEQMGRAEGLAQRETVLNAREAANLLKISPRLLRRTIRPWRRFGESPSGDRWLLSDLLSKLPA